jgi:hypothetical protein
MKTFDMSWICLQWKTPEQESNHGIRSAQIPLPRTLPQHNPMRLKHINLRTQSQQYHTHASTDSMSSPIPHPAHLAACPSRKRVSVTLPTKPAFDQLDAPHGGRGLNSPGRSPTYHLRACGLEYPPTHARPTHLSRANCSVGLIAQGQ